MAERFDAIIVGAGQGGVPIAQTLARFGRRTALIESTHVGGTCVNVGCTPTKTMVASARAAHLARHAGEVGVKTGEVHVDMKAVRARKREIVNDFRTSSERYVKETEGLELLMGTGAFSGDKTITVELNDGGSRELAADLIIIDVGTRPSPLPVEGADAVPILNSTTIMELDAVPDHLVIVGGGSIGLEFGQMFRRFGANVTILHRSSRLLKNEDSEFSQAMLDILRGEGIGVRLNASASELRGAAGKIEIISDCDGKRETFTCSHILNATGRMPNCDTLKPEVSGIEVNDKGYIVTNERLETSQAGIYAIGEIAGNPAYTHISYDDYRILEANLLHDGSRTTKDRPAPYAIFTDPEFARVGLSETEANKKGIPVKVATLEMTGVARAIEMNETAGLMRGVVHADTGEILGFAILGVMGAELQMQVQFAMTGKLKATDIANAVITHPTLAGGLSSLFSQVA